jgi:hypothetical protein
VANTNSNLIANPATFIPVMNPTGKDYGRVYFAQDNFEVLGLDIDAIGDTVSLVKVPAIARPLSIKVAHDDLGSAAAAFHCGVYDDQMVAKDNNAFASSYSVAAASAFTELIDNNTPIPTAMIGDTLWEWAGDASQPERGTEYIIALTTTAIHVGNNGTIAFQIMWAYP